MWPAVNFIVMGIAFSALVAKQGVTVWKTTSRLEGVALMIAALFLLTFFLKSAIQSLPN